MECRQGYYFVNEAREIQLQCAVFFNEDDKVTKRSQIVVTISSPWS